MDLVGRALPLLLRGLAVTVGLGISAFVIGCGLGLAIALARFSGGRLLRFAAGAYVSVFRGTPLLVQILLIYFALPQVGVRLEPIPSALLALSLNASAYLGENFRSGLVAVDKGQWEAALSLGMASARILRRIILPQAIRVALPPIGSRFIALMKDTSLASVVTVVELTRVAENVGSATFRYMEMFVIVGVMYWIVNTLLQLVQEGLERRMQRAY
ncbi:MAG TPA: amino acid ABC transporter permease [bacterium]|nr:amino acid ABC transporter permease [bacterium]